MRSPALLWCIVGLGWLVNEGRVHAAERTDEESITVAVDTSRRFQTMRGFGASGAWWPNYVAEFPAEDRERLLRLLFTEAGADLSIYRCNLPAGDGPDVTDPVRRTVGVETAPGVYDFDRDWRSQRILREVRALGVERFVLFSKSPPPRLLRNGKVSGGEEGGPNLLPEGHADFARYLLDLTEHYTREFDLPHVVLSPINEPQWRWGLDHRMQEGCYYEPAEMAAMVRALAEARRARGIEVEIEASESGEWKGDNYAHARALFDDAELARELRAFAVHSYWSSAEDRRRFVEWFRARYPDKALVMSEYCQMEHGHDLSIEGGLHLAEVLHEDLVVASVESWQWWLAVFGGGYKDALIYAHPETRKIEPTKRLWVMGNYSRFVRPGATRVAVEVETANGEALRASAFQAPDGRSVALILINPGAERVIRPALRGNDGASGNAAWATSAELDLSSIPVDREGRVRLPEKSVVTVTFSL